MSFNSGSNFDFVASTGRTATTYIALVLNMIDGVAACHEGYQGSEKDSDPVLPLINLENAQAYNSQAAAEQIVREKRNPQDVAAALVQTGQQRLVDVAYYNPMIGLELLRQLPECRMIGIIRDCESFVRSCTTMTAEDPLPVGWPDPAKELTAREKFIGMGRIRPRRSSEEKALWKGWSAIRRNIWLWQETNLRLCAAKSAFPDRVSLARFETFQTDPQSFWQQVSATLHLPKVWSVPPAAKTKAVNKKPFGYQVAPATDWTAEEISALKASQNLINERADYDC
jgi:hypothetical protein